MPDPQKKSVSASQIAALFDRSPYLTKWLLWQWFKNGLDVDSEESNRMDWGKRLEPLLLDEARTHYGLDIQPDQGYARHPLAPIGCTRDAIAYHPQRGPGAIETKCCFDYGVWMQKWDGGNRPPIEYEIQLQAQMLVGADGKPFEWGAIVAWCGADVTYFDREPDEEVQKALIDEARGFFASLAADDEPDPMADPKEVPYFAKAWGTEPDTEQTLDDPDLAQTVTEWEWAKQQRAFFDKMAKNKQAEILVACRDVAITKAPDVIVQVSRKEIPAATIERKESTRTTIKPTLMRQEQTNG